MHYSLKDKTESISQSEKVDVKKKWVILEKIKQSEFQTKFLQHQRKQPLQTHKWSQRKQKTNPKITLEMKITYQSKDTPGT